MSNWNQGGGYGYGPGPGQGGGYGPPPHPQYYQPPPPQTVYVQTAVVKAPFNHVPHLVLTLLSCGAWIPIWLICWACH